MSYVVVELLFDERVRTTLDFIASLLYGHMPDLRKPPETALVENEILKSLSKSFGKSIFRMVFRRVS